MTTCAHALTPSGLEAVANLGWGDHVCHFYRSAQDLADTLIPYFKRGIEENEACLWVTSEPYPAERAVAELGMAVSDLRRRMDRGQISILSHAEWYTRTQARGMRGGEILEGWLRMEQQALNGGWRGLRVSGNTAWLSADAWDDFMEYESAVSATFRGRRIVALCSYASRQCSGEAVLDVLKSHEFAFSRRGGNWELVETAAQKRAKSELAFLNEQLEQRVEERTAELSAAVERHRAAEERKDEFLATLSHELRNPLAPILNAVEFIGRRGSADPEIRSARDIVERQLNHLVRLVDDLLEVSRISGGRIELRRQRLRASEVVSHALEAAQPLIRANRHRLELRTPEDDPCIDGDRVRLSQVVLNLLNNAAKYTPPGGRILVEVRRTGPRVEIAVVDDGIGLRSDQLETVFELFARFADTHRSVQDGLGIGLSLAREIARLHGGEVEAQSDGPGRGSRFTLRLPAAGDAVPEQPATPSAGTDAARRRILVVDDNRDGADSLAMNLELAGHAVRVVYDGPSALDALEEFPAEFVLLDIGMCGMDGYEVAQRIRRLPRGRHIRLVAITGWGQDQDKRRAAEAGFDAHLTKPVEMSVLSRLISGDER